MTVELDEKDFIANFWVADDLDGNNFLMLMRKREGQWIIDYRFRYIRDEKVFDSTDEKYFFQVKSKPGVSELEIKEVCEDLFRLVGKRYYMNRLCQCVNGNMEKFMEVLQKYECFHRKITPRGVQNEGP